ncbi:7-carboxy-7-deazaguanine synthase QueE [Desulfurobacterium sp.]
MKLYEIFSSIQGEGLQAGLVASFVRFAGCPLSCRYCDTAEARIAGREVSVEEIIARLEEQAIPDVVVTGGEPLVQDEIGDFLFELSSRKWVRRIFVETSGLIFRRDILFSKVYFNLSPKPPSMGVDFSLESVESFIVRFPDRVTVKFLILDENDLSWSIDFIDAHKAFFLDKGVVFQPIEVPHEEYFATVRKVINLIVKEKRLISQYVVKIIPQIHKLVGVK